MAYNITYTVTKGVPPVFVEIIGYAVAPNIHSTVPSQDTFENIPYGDYTLRFTDSMGCIETEELELNPSTTTTTTT